MLRSISSVVSFLNFSYSSVSFRPLQQNLWVPRRRDSPRILTSNKLYPILMGIKVVATSQLPIQTSDLRGQRLRRGCLW